LSSKTAVISLGDHDDDGDERCLSLKCVAELVLPEHSREFPDFELTRDVYEESEDDKEARRLVAGFRIRRRRITLADTLLAHYLATNTSTWKLLRRLIKQTADLKEKERCMRAKATPQNADSKRPLQSQSSVTPKTSTDHTLKEGITLEVSDEPWDDERRKQRVDLDNINVVIRKYEAELRKYFVQAVLDEIYTDYTEATTTA